MKNFTRTLTLLFFISFLNQIQAQNISALTNRYIVATTSASTLTNKDISDFKVTNTHVSKSSGITHTYIQQQHNGIPIFNAVMGIHVDADGSLIKLDNQFISNVASKVNSDQPRITALVALEKVAQQLGIESANKFEILENRGGKTNEILIAPSDVAQEDIKVQLTYQPISKNEVRLCWNMIILEKNGQNWWDLRADANTGEILHQFNMMIQCNFEHHHQLKTHDHSHDCHTHNKSLTTLENNFVPNSYRCYDIPLESPNHGATSIIVDPADPIASPFGWHDTDGVAGADDTTTRGNNVNAQEDHFGDNGSGYAPDGGANLEFDFTADFSASPCDSPFKDAAITNLFVWNNYMHDIWYQYGFDEASGNFQENNYNNGGVAGDRVNADAQDGSGTNNANFGTPADGANPRMQMFLWGAGISTNTFDVNSPASIAGAYESVIGQFGAQTFSVTEEVIIVDDGSAAPTEACNALVNGADVSGKIALIDRGNCEFGTKALNAENAGAIAVIICQNTGDAPFSMGAGAVGSGVSIPSVMISRNNCDVIRAQIPTVNITIESTNMVTSCSGRDGDFDNGIIAHEYGHGISTRLAGGAGNSGCLNTSEQMGEGWSDWFGLMLTIEPGDVGTDGRGIGTYAIGQGVNGGGIRPFRYSTDLGVNPHSYEDINSVSVPHGVGSVWCAMLWEMTWELIAQHGYDPDLYYGTGGNNIAMNLVIEGLKLMSCSPGFVDGRDAILAADQAIYGGANTCSIWKAFAKRGLGFGASQGSANNLNDSVESYTTPPSCIQFVKTADKVNASQNEEISYTISVENTSNITLNDVVFSDPIPANTSVVSGSISNGGTVNNGVINWPSFTLSPFQNEERTFKVLVDPSVSSAQYSILDDVESGNTLWTITSTNDTYGDWVLDTSNPNSGTTAWYANDVGTNGENNEMYLMLTDAIAPTSTSVLSFNHYFDTETNWDGGRIQYSFDGNTWTNFTTADFIQNGYNGFVDNDPSTEAFSGLSGGGATATYINSVLDLSAFDGQVISIRFWMHLDPATGADGWYIDDIQINDLVRRIPNIARMNTSERLVFISPLANPTLIIDAGDCVLNADYSGVLSVNSYQVGNVLSSSGQLQNGNVTTFSASCIELNADFEVELGADFLAEINPCTPFTSSVDALQAGDQFSIVKSAKKGILKLDEDGLSDLKMKLTALDGSNMIHQLSSDQLQKVGQQYEIDLSKFLKGAYLIQISTGEQTYTKKIIIE